MRLTEVRSRSGRIPRRASSLLSSVLELNCRFYWLVGHNRFVCVYLVGQIYVFLRKIIQVRLCFDNLSKERIKTNCRKAERRKIARFPHAKREQHSGCLDAVASLAIPQRPSWKKCEQKGLARIRLYGGRHQRDN